MKVLNILKKIGLGLCAASTLLFLGACTSPAAEDVEIFSDTYGNYMYPAPLHFQEDEGSYYVGHTQYGPCGPEECMEMCGPCDTPYPTAEPEYMHVPEPGNEACDIEESCFELPSLSDFFCGEACDKNYTPRCRAE